jgi:hypothetical protein
MNDIIEYTGQIEILQDISHYTVKLIQEDGYKIDLLLRFKELAESYPNSKFQISYFITDKRLSKSQALREYYKNLLGNEIRAKYRTTQVQYSSTSVDEIYTTSLKIGGHDLYKELVQYKKKYLILKITIIKTAD